jgi:small ligand-binding sensory domain FIST
MQWINALSTRPSLEGAVDEVVALVKRSLDTTPDLGIIFISSAYTSDFPRLMPLILESLPIPVIIGCGGGGIVGMKNGNQVLEVEEQPALSLTVAKLPEVEITPFHLLSSNLPDLDSSPDDWSDTIGVAPSKQPHFILLSDPFSSGINDLLEGLDFAYPTAVKIGGLASSGSMGLPSALFYYCETDPDQVLLRREGTIGVALSGKITIDTIVAQGCRPIGQVYQVAKGDRNVILELSELERDTSPSPPLELLRALIQSLDESDQRLAQHSLFIGIAGDEFKLELKPGDFLIRNLIGVDPRMGAIAIGDRIRAGQRVQFHLRDGKTSAEDLEFLLNTYQQVQSDNSSAIGALLFSCLGRGQGLYGKPNFDSQLFLSYINNIPLGGFFCNGEIGPVGRQTFLHGYTSAFGIIRQLN